MLKQLVVLVKYELEGARNGRTGSSSTLSKLPKDCADMIAKIIPTG